jgi:rhodanese-related sulfurtransferase
MNDIHRRLILTFLLAILVLALLGCATAANVNAKTSDQPASPSVQQISMDEAMKVWRNKEIVFIDVRTPEEYKQGHVPGAILIPLSELESRRNEVARDKKVLLICRSGARSAQANLILQKYGFTNTFSVNGGMLEWRDEVEK